MDFLRQIKYFIQRGRRGWSDQDAWSIHGYLSEVMPPMLRKLKGGIGCPSEFFDREYKNNECADWHEALEEMAQAFEIAEKVSWHKYGKWQEGKNGGKTWIKDEEAEKQAVEKMEKGLQLFTAHFLNLWD